MAGLKAEFAKRNCKILALSVDSVSSHDGWVNDIEETQRSRINYPILADEDHKVSDLYDMIHPNADDTFTVRSVFIIDPERKLRLTLTYPASTGRNFDEIVRVVDSLQLTDTHKVATPVNWNQGDDVIILPTLSDEEAKELFPRGWETLKPYLRMVKLPR